jgi:phosphohistidine phosphatase SixA
MHQIHYDFIRHAEAGSHEDDGSRTITEDGVVQCLHRVTMLNRTYDAVIGSTALCVKETATRLAPGLPIVMSEALYLPTKPDDRTVIRKLSKELGNAPLRSYLAADKTEVLLRYARHAERFIRRMSEEPPTNRTALVVGHAVLLQAIGTMFTGDVKLFDLVIGTCEGFSVDTERQFIPIND